MKLTINTLGKIIAAATEWHEKESECSVLMGFSIYSLMDEKEVPSFQRFMQDVVGGSDVMSCRLHLKMTTAEDEEFVCFACSSADKQSVHLSIQRIPSAVDSDRRLNEAQERLRALFYEMPVAVLIVEQSGLIQAVNPTTERLFGKPSRQLTKTSVFDLFDYEKSKVERDQLAKEVTTASGTMMRLIGKRQMGERFQSVPLELSVAMLNSGVYMLSLFDISERVAHEKMKQEFIAMVSHDLKAPLSCVRAGISMLRHLDIDTTSDAGQETLKEIEEESERLIHFIDDLLDLSRLESG
ncbi:MAG: PAS domain S-box protein, partial [Cyanobacteria bacterium]|nr:PAS domain S-box protein [Cyanobacteriota bacterium]